MEYTVHLFGASITVIFALIAVIYSTLKAESKTEKTERLLEVKTERDAREKDIEYLSKECTTLTLRLQKVEDVQGNKIDNLSQDFKDFKKDIGKKIDDLTNMVHNEKNQENVLNNTMVALLKHLENTNPIEKQH